MNIQTENQGRNRREILEYLMDEYGYKTYTIQILSQHFENIEIRVNELDNSIIDIFVLTRR